MSRLERPDDTLATSFSRRRALALIAAGLAASGCSSDDATEDGGAKPGPSATGSAGGGGGGGSQTADRAKLTENLKGIGLAIANELSQSDAFLPPSIDGSDSTPLLSWRVALLPYLVGQPDAGALFKRFKLNEPWDGPTNRPLLAEMPPIYAAPGVSRPGEGLTYFRAIVGPGAFLERGRRSKLAELKGPRNAVIMIVEAGEAVPWTRPEEVDYDPKGPLPRLGGASRSGFHAVCVDGTVYFLRDDLSESDLHALITGGVHEASHLRRLMR
jgi:hypothetical protein